jgi:hypothetical protein
MKIGFDDDDDDDYDNFPKLLFNDDVRIDIIYRQW